MRALLLLLLISACESDETLTGHGALGIWVLSQINDAPVTARSTISFEPDGKVTGAAPCNRYFAEQRAPYPWFDLSPIAATKMACPKLAHETRFFGILSTMTLVEVSREVLILSNDAGDSMLFKTQPGD